MIQRSVAPRAAGEPDRVANKSPASGAVGWRPEWRPPMDGTEQTTSRDTYPPRIRITFEAYKRPGRQRRQTDIDSPRMGMDRR